MGVSRRKQRELTFQTLYMFEVLGEKADVSKLLELSWTCYDKKELPYSSFILEYALANKGTFVKILNSLLIGKKSLKNISNIDKAILYTSMSEILNTDIEAAVIINEAVELSKKFSSEISHNFIHAVLHNFIKNKEQFRIL